MVHAGGSTGMRSTRSSLCAMKCIPSWVLVLGHRTTFVTMIPVYDFHDAFFIPRSSRCIFHPQSSWRDLNSSDKRRVTANSASSGKLDVFKQTSFDSSCPMTVRVSSILSSSSSLSVRLCCFILVTCVVDALHSHSHPSPCRSVFFPRAKKHS